MSDMLLAILAYTLTGLLYKLGAGNRQNALSVNTAVFGGGTAAALLLGLVLSNLAWDRPAVVMGVIAGLASVTANVTLLRAVRLGRLAVSWTIFSLAVVIPVCLAVFIWHEQVTQQRIASVVATIAALILLGADKAGQTGDHGVHRAQGRATWLCLIVAAFLSYGLLMSMNKMFEESGSHGSRFGYLSVCYGMGFMVSVILQAWWRPRVRGSDMAFGGGIGLGSVLGAFFLLRALSLVPAVLVFPSVSVGNVVLVAAVSALVFREKVGWKGWTGIAVGALALVLGA